MGESLLLSWLRHVKECQMVQLNWKPSMKWELHNKELIDQLMDTSSALFTEKFDYSIYKKNKNVSQLIRQAEIDVMGMNITDNESHIYAIDVAFHESGLNYGNRAETTSSVIKKCLRTAMCLLGYFKVKSGTIIFASPKITNSVLNDINATLDHMDAIFRDLQLDFKIRIIANDDFSKKILQPVLSTLDDVADTSELFMRSLQMYNMFAEKPRAVAKQSISKPNKSSVSKELTPIDYEGLDGVEEMKIGTIVRTILSKKLQSNTVPKEEIERMQGKDYCIETFHIRYPLLLKTDPDFDTIPVRYYATPIKIYEDHYFLCSEWFEVAANNDRPYLIKWLLLHTEKQN